MQPYLNTIDATNSYTCPLKQMVGLPSLSTPDRIRYEYLPAGHSSCRLHGALL